METSLFQNIGRIILGLFMILAGIGHLTFQREEFVAQVPKWFPNNSHFVDFIVVSSGIVEIALGFSMIFLIRHKVKVRIA